MCHGSRARCYSTICKRVAQCKVLSLDEPVSGLSGLHNPLVSLTLDPMNGRFIGCVLAVGSLPRGRLGRLGLLRVGSLARGASRAGAPAAGHDASKLAPDGQETLEPAACRLHRPGWRAS